jgi:hypothetical protein
MARMDSLILVMLGLAQIMIGDDLLTGFLSILLQGTGGGTIVMAIYFLIFLSKHQSELSDTYSKIEKTTLIRDDSSGKLKFVDASPVATKVMWYIIPVGLTVIGAIFWLADL